MVVDHADKDCNFKHLCKWQLLVMCEYVNINLVFIFLSQFQYFPCRLYKLFVNTAGVHTCHNSFQLSFQQTPANEEEVDIQFVSLCSALAWETAQTGVGIMNDSLEFLQILLSKLSAQTKVNSILSVYISTPSIQGPWIF